MNEMIQILVDADGLPKMIKEILFRAAVRLKIKMILVSNKKIQFSESVWISNVLVPNEPDAADHKIVELAQKGDLVITADIPLSGRVIEKGAFVIGLRGEVYTADNIKQRLSVRNFMEILRDTGVQTSGPGIYRPKDRQEFANQLDSFLTRRLKKE